VTPAFLRSYAGQVKIFLVLLVLFLAVAIYFDFYLLVIARNAIQEEAGLRLGIEADLLRTELERDQMLRGLSAPPETPPFVPPTYLDRLARLHGLRRVDLLSTEARILSSSDAARIGGIDSFLMEEKGRERRRLLAGVTVITALDRAGRTPYATLAAYRPIRDRDRDTRAFIRLEREVPALASVDFDLRRIAALQACGLAFVLLLVILFARWLLRPYRRLQEAAGLAAAPAPSAGMDDAEALVTAVQGVLEKMRAQEGELLALKGSAERSAGEAPGLPGERLLSGMTSAALVFDRDGRLVTLNAAAERLLAIAPQPPGRAAADLLAAHAPLLDLVRGGLLGEARSREVVTLLAPDGRPAHVGVMLSPIRGVAGAPGAVAIDGVVCLLTDLTEIRALRERARLRDNLAVLGEMSAGIAHEFRNALAVIQGHARLQSRALVREPARVHAEAIEREAARLLRVVGDFLRYARPVTPDLAEIDLTRLVRETADDFRAEAGNAGVTLAVEGAFPPILADERLLKQALQNLLRNASEAVRDDPRGSGAPRTIVVRGREEPGERGRVRIEVEDDGPGISAEDRPHIFTPFYTTRHEGTGLGLPLVQKAAALHDGTVEALPRPGGGTCMVLVLPLRPAPPVPIDLVA